MPPRKRPPPPPVKDPVGAALPAAFSLAPVAPPPPEPAVSAEALGKLEAALAIPSHDVAKEVETLPAAAQNSSIRRFDRGTVRDTATSRIFSENRLRISTGAVYRYSKYEG